MRLFGVSFGLPVFFQGLGFGFVQGDGYYLKKNEVCLLSPNFKLASK
jgi:hypothetical protein